MRAIASPRPRHGLPRHEADVATEQEALAPDVDWDRTGDARETRGGGAPARQPRLLRHGHGEHSEVDALSTLDAACAEQVARLEVRRTRRGNPLRVRAWAIDDRTRF